MQSRKLPLPNYIIILIIHFPVQSYPRNSYIRDMAPQKGKHSKRFKNHLHNNDAEQEPEIDLNAGGKDQHDEDGFLGYVQPDFKSEKNGRLKRDAIVIGVFLVIFFFWVNDWRPLEALGMRGDSGQVTEVVQSQSGLGAGIDILAYTDEVNQLDFAESPDQNQITALYQNDVPLDYLRDLNRIGFLEELSYSGVIGLYANGVLADYIRALERIDYLDELDYSGVIGLYANDVPEGYLRGLNRTDYLDELDYSGIIGLYANDVPLDYIQTLNRIDYLDELDYSGIIGLYANGVSEDFLRELNRRDMLDGLSYSDIISLYMTN